MEIVIIGAGNVGTHLGLALKESGHTIQQIFSRTKESAKIASERIDCKYTSNLTDIYSTADIYILALKDDIVEEIANKLNTNGLIVHTSGSISIDILKKQHLNYGVLYPFQTFSKGIQPIYKSIPFCIEANNKENCTTIEKLATSVSDSVTHLSSEKRRILHLSAIFSCNFTNFMYTIAEEILRKHEIPFSISHPLINETSKKATKFSPSQVQTGPAVRGDIDVINKHIDLLSEHPDYKKIYQLLSNNLSDKK